MHTRACLLCAHTTFSHTLKIRIFGDEYEHPSEYPNFTPRLFLYIIYKVYVISCHIVSNKDIIQSNK